MSSSEASSSRLVGWKDIAAYLGRSVRAVQRWERELGLPVHRVRSSAGQTVYALREELDEWLARVDTGLPVAGEEAQADPPAPRRKFILTALAAGVVLAAVTGVWVFWSPADARVAPARFRTAGNELQALDHDGDVLWTYRFPRRVVTPLLAPTYPALTETRTEDLDGDGAPEVLAVVALESSGESEAESEGLYCWSASGNLLWTYRPADSLTFEGGMSFSAPWIIVDYAISSAAPRRVFVSVADGTWWGSFIARVETNGRAERLFVHGGMPYRLLAAERDGRTLVAAATISNEHGSTGLMVIDGDGPPGRWPQEPSPFRCVDCAAGVPVSYVLLPPSDLSEADNAPYNRPHALLRRGNVLVAQVQEELSKWPNFPARMFRFDLSGKPIGYAPGDGYAIEHAAFEARKLLNHRFEDCPDAARPLKTRMWTPAERWRDVVIPLDNTAMRARE